MQRVDGAYLYEFGAEMRALASLEEKNCKRLEIYFPLSPAVNALNNMIYNSIFSSGWKLVQRSAQDLLKAMNEHLVDFSDINSFDIEVSDFHIRWIKGRYSAFEAIMKAELQNIDIYYVSQKGGFDSRCLTEDGTQLFSQSLAKKCPQAVDDIKMGSRCLAFELWTAMGFHFHRANEAVLRAYFDLVIGSAKKPKIRTMGTMIKALDDAGAGDQDIRAAIKNIIVFHRNPLAHPDQHIQSADEALSLYAAIRACMGYMLDKLPDLEVPALAATPTAVDSDPQLQLS